MTVETYPFLSSASEHKSQNSTRECLPKKVVRGSNCAHAFVFANLKLQRFQKTARLNLLQVKFKRLQEKISQSSHKTKRYSVFVTESPDLLDAVFIFEMTSENNQVAPLRCIQEG